MRQTPARTSTIRYGTHDASSACKLSVSGRADGVSERDDVNPDAPTIVLLLAKGDEELMHVGDEFVPIESDLSLANRLIDVTQFD